MKFAPTPLAGALVMGSVPIADERGFFARTFCRDELAGAGVDFQIVQCNISHNRLRGTVRGMHFQKPPHEEDKIVSCIRGAIFDVIIDLREGSATRGKWFGVELSDANHKLLYVPKGFAHGFQTLRDGCDVYYQMSQFYAPGAASGVRFDDGAFGIGWPLPVTVVSDKDRAFADYKP